MNEVLMFLGHAYQAYRAYQDSGGWIIQSNMEVITSRIEAFFAEKGLI